MTLYQISWFPKCYGDCEKHYSYVLAENQRDAWKIAKEKYNMVQVAEVCTYSSISGGDSGKDYWADYIMKNGKIEVYNPSLAR